MPTANAGPSQSPFMPWGVAIVATSVLLIGGGAIIWAHREPAPTEIGVAPGGPPVTFRRVPPLIREDRAMLEATAVATTDLPEGTGASSGLHSVAYAVEHGTRVVKIRVVPNGDELVIDAATGRLLETRPSRATPPTPAGRFVAPYVPNS